MAATTSKQGPVVIAYDGSDHARAAIEAAGRELRDGRAALVVTVWQSPQSVPFLDAPVALMPQQLIDRIIEEARGVAAEGAELANAAGFDAQPLVEQGEPIWERIVELAEENDAAMVVMGSRGRSGLGRLTTGSVATAVVQHSRRPVLIGRAA